MAIEIYGIELSDFVSIIALVVSAVVPAVLFYVGHKRRTRSEQFRFSLEIWDHVATHAKNIHRWLELDAEDRKPSTRDLTHTLETMRTDLKFFVYLAEKGEINDPDVREYYREPLSLVLISALGLKTKYSNTENVYIKYFTQSIINLIEKYYKLIGKMKEFRDIAEGRIQEPD